MIKFLKGKRRRKMEEDSKKTTGTLDPVSLSSDQEDSPELRRERKLVKLRENMRKARAARDANKISGSRQRGSYRPKKKRKGSVESSLRGRRPFKGLLRRPQRAFRKAKRIGLRW